MIISNHRQTFVKARLARLNEDEFSLTDRSGHGDYGARGEALALRGDGTQVSLTTLGSAYTQNFDTLASAGTSSTLPTDWFFSESLANANSLYTAGTGSSNAGDTYSFGATGNSERAFGTLLSGSLASAIGATFTNNTGSTITSLLVSYFGEQWRLGATGRNDRLDFEISFNATSLTTGTWTAVDALDFIAPNSAGTVGLLDGNAAANRAAVSGTISSLTIANGATFWIRWLDFNATGADDGLAIDDFSLTPSGAAPTPGQLSIDDVALAEGDAGTVSFVFTVSRANGSSGAVGATWTLNAPGGANNADAGDFSGAQLFTGTVSFADGETSKTITVTVQGDDLVETDEAFTLVLSAPTGGVTITADNTGFGTILNDDAAGTLSIGDVTLAEGDVGATTAFTFTVSRSSGDDGAVSASWTLNAPGGAGLADSGDFDGGQPTSGTVSFADGELLKTITILVQGDAVFEASETFLVTLSAPTGGAALGDANGTGTITNDDPAPAGSLSIDDVSHGEGDVGTTTTYTFTVTRSAGTAGAVTANYTISAPGGAGNASTDDFVAGAVFSGQVAFADGETSQTISIDVEGDVDVEPNENFTVTLSNAQGGASISDDTGVGTIVNDDVPPPAGQVSIADASIVEGDAGTSILILTLTRIGGTGAFSVDFATANGGNPLNASATAGSDYLASSGTVSFANGQTMATVQITINGDVTPELDEEFTVNLSNATNGATIADSSAIATIETDDPQPATTRIFDENFDGFTAGGFAPNPTATQIDSDIWRVVGLSDIPNPAYGFTATTGDFARGTIAANDPTTAGVYSPVSNPALVVQPTGAELEAGGFIEARITNGSGSTATGFDIAFDWVFRNSGDRASSLVFSYSTDGTNFVTLPAAAFTTPAVAGAATATFSTQNELLSLTGLSVANGAFIYLRWTHASSSGGGNRDEVGIDNLIVDATGGATGPLVSVADVSVNEAAGTMTFTITRANAAAGAFTVDYATANGTATAGSDYAATSGTLSFADNQVTATVTVTINDEAIAELDETVLLNLSNPSGATIADGQGVGTIVNDDGTPIQVSINDVSIVEGDSGSQNLVFTLTRTGGGGAFDVNFQTVDGTAISTFGPGQDYVTTTGTVNFLAGQMTATISVPILGDTVPESNESFQVQLTSATNNAVIVDAFGTGTIVNDEPTFIHDIQGTAYFSPILAGDGITAFNTASTTLVTVRAIVTAVDDVGNRQGYYLTEEYADWDGNSYTSEGIFVMTRNDAGVGSVVSGVSVGDLVQLSANVMEYQAFSTMPRTVLVNPTGFSLISSGNPLPTMILTAIPNEILTAVTPDYRDSSDGAGDTFDASLYALSYFETVEGMLVTVPNMVVADGFVDTSGGDPFFQAYSLDSANADQINSRGGYTIAGDPPVGPPDTAGTGDDTVAGGRHLHDGDVNPDIIELDFTDFAMSAPPGLLQNATMGDLLGDVTGIIDFDFTDRKLFVTAMEPGGFVDGGNPVQETTALGDDGRSLTVATFNVENLDPGDGAARFAALAQAIANNLNAPDIICIEEIQDNNGAAAGGTDASTTWQMLVDALNAATGKVYQWVDQEPNGSEGGEPGGNIRVGFLYDTGRVQLGNLAPDATLAERRQYTDRIGDGVRDAGDLIAFSDDMIAAEVNTADWSSTRRSLLGEFTFNGNVVYVTANHFTAKGGSGQFYQFDQDLATGDPENAGWAKRSEQAQDVYAMLNFIEGGAPGVGIVAGGDFNDFYFYRPLTTLTGYTLANGNARVGGARFDNLTLTLAEAERYTYTFDGRSQAIDHIIANQLLSGVATYDVVHLNTGYNSNGSNPALSDHDPGLSSFDFRGFAEVLNGTAAADSIDGFGGDDVITGGGGNDQITGGIGTDTAVFAGNQADYTITPVAGGGFTVTDNNAANGNEGTDTLIEVERIQFADGVVTLGQPGASPPSVDLNGAAAGINASVSYTEDGPGVSIGTGIVASDPDEALGDRIESATITLTDALAGDALTLTGALPAGFAAVTTTGPGTITLTITGTGTGATYSALLDSVLYSTSDQNPTDLSRTITVTVNDGQFSSPVATSNVVIIPQDDAPVAQPDGFATDEATAIVGASVFPDNGSGPDSDVDGPALSVSAVNGSTGDVGDEILLASGALLTLRADGTFDYDPNGAFDDLPGPASGASNLTDTDSFNYTLTGGNTVTVTITVSGLDSDGDVLLGTAGADTLDGGIGSDTMTGFGGDDVYLVDEAGDVVIEASGEGNDTIRSSLDYTLGAGLSVENLTTTNQAGTDPIDLTGNGLDNRIEGNAGVNILAGLGGQDLLYGHGGDDQLAGGADNDLIDGGAGIDSASFAASGLGFVDGAIGWIVQSSEGNDVLQAVEIVVDGTGQRNLLVGSSGFANLQTALGNAQAGDTIRLAAGNYAGAWSYDDANLTIVAQPGARINGTFTPAGADGITIAGANLDDIITTGAGNDRILFNVTTGGSDTVNLGAGTDVVALSGNAGQIRLTFRSSEVGNGDPNDSVLGGLNVRLQAENGSDGLSGPQSRIDDEGVVFVAGAGQTFDVRDVSGIQRGDQFQVVVLGTQAADVLVAVQASRPYYFNGGMGDDSISGGIANDFLVGGAGNDLLNGGAGIDTGLGGGGNDAYIVEQAGDLVLESAGGGYDTVYALTSYELGVNQEIEVLTVYDRDTSNAIDLTGNNLANTIYGNQGTNLIIGGGGDDIMFGLGGNDSYIVEQAGDEVIEGAGGGFDTVYTLTSYDLATDQAVETLTVYDRSTMNALDLGGNNLDNTIYGNAGTNMIAGRGGNDSLYGMGGADIFKFTTAPGAGNVDAIMDFSDDDTIALDADAFLGIGGFGTLDEDAFVIGTSAEDAEDRIIYDQATGRLWFDADGNGDGAAVLFATLADNPILTASDFTVI